MEGTNRADTTKLLGDILVANRLSGAGRYYAREVSIDPWTDHGKRVDFMQFIPENQMSISGIEKGIFVCYEVKSCKEDLYSGHGLNFFGEKNYIVTTMECYKSILNDQLNGKISKYLFEHHPESSQYYGFLVALPCGRTMNDEFIQPTPFEGEFNDWELRVVKNCRLGPRNRSATELLFCMLRSRQRIDCGEDEEEK